MPKLPKVSVTQKRVSALTCQLVGAIREPGLQETLKATNPIFPLSTHYLSPGVCTAAHRPAEGRFQPLSPAQQCTPFTLPGKAGTSFTLEQRHCWIKTPPIQSILCISLRMLILVVDFFVYLLFQDLCKASSFSHDSLEVHRAALSRAGCTRANQETDQKTENLCTKSMLLPRTIEYDWNIKEFLVTVWGRERIIC